jgi:hypothetical protein
MEKKELKRITTYLGIILIVGTIIILTFKGCKNKPTDNPAVTRLETINDSLFKVIDKNTKAANELYLKLDSLNFRSDTIIERQYTVNKYYKDEIYNILNSDDPTANKQFRSTLQKSDSLLKSGFYTRTYDLRPSANESKLH